MKKLLSIILFLPILAGAQPLVFLGASRASVQKYMSRESNWSCTENSSDKLSYENNLLWESVSYQFERNNNGLFRVCVQYTVTLKDSTAADIYQNERTILCRFIPDNDSWLLNTDLIDAEIRVIRSGNSFIYKF